MKLHWPILFCVLLTASAGAEAGTFTFTTDAQATAGTTYVSAGKLFHLVDPQFGVDESFIDSNLRISADQFASTGDVNSAVAGINASIAATNASINGLGSSINSTNVAVTSLTSSVAGFSGFVSSVGGSLAMVQNSVAHLYAETWSGAALAASLTPILPADGKANHINIATANANGYQAVSVNYARVEGSFDFVAGAAFTEKYGLAKVGVGFSW